jgi:hypothetical protein
MAKPDSKRTPVAKIRARDLRLARERKLKYGVGV